jgi:hypothetical protein
MAYSYYNFETGHQTEEQWQREQWDQDAAEIERDRTERRRLNNDDGQHSRPATQAACILTAIPSRSARVAAISFGVTRFGPSSSTTRCFLQ